MRRFEFKDGTSNKFWEVKTEGPKLMVRFGRIGGTWQESDKLLADADKANAQMEKLVREKTSKGYVEVGKKAPKKVASKAKTNEPKTESMAATISPAERKTKAQKVLLMFANGEWELAHNILENAQEEEWLFEQLLNGCKIEDGEPIPSNAIKKAIKKDEKSSPVLAMLNIMLCIPHGSKLLKTFKFEKLTETLYLESLTSLSDSAAEALSKHKGDLDLSRLESLSDAAAESLSKHKGDLDLYGLKSLSDAAAESLSKHKGDLGLGGLKSLSDAAAKSLSNHKGDLYLQSLEHLSDAAAEALSKHKGDLGLGGLKSLSDAAAESLSKHKGDLDLYGLKSLSDAAAESLSKHKGDLGLGGLKSLSDAAAKSLSNHKGDLSLYGLESLSDAAAEALSKHKGKLYLWGLKSLSDAAAESLSKHKGTLHFSYSLEKKVEKYKNQGGKK